MKVGDLVRYRYPGRERPHPGDIGIILDGPKRKPRRDQWEVWWMYCKNYDGTMKVGWWDDTKLEVANESR